jgi:hypothetical protein
MRPASASHLEILDRSEGYVTNVAIYELHLVLILPSSPAEVSASWCTLPTCKVARFVMIKCREAEKTEKFIF